MMGAHGTCEQREHFSTAKKLFLETIVERLYKNSQQVMCVCPDACFPRNGVSAERLNVLHGKHCAVEKVPSPVKTLFNSHFIAKEPPVIASF